MRSLHEWAPLPYTSHSMKTQLLLLTAFLSVFIPRFATAETHATQLSATNVSDTAYASVLKCGPNSLFMFLVMSGQEGVTLEQLDNLPVSADGTSLLALRDTARKFGVDAEVRQYDAKEIRSLPLPAIGLFNSNPSSVTRYHYCVIYRVDDEKAYLIDGTTGQKNSIRLEKLAHFWTGVAMAQDQTLVHAWTSGWRPAALVTCLVIVDIAVVAFYLNRRKSHKPAFAPETEVAV